MGQGRQSEPRSEWSISSGWSGTSRAEPDHFKQCFGSGSAWIRITICLLDTDPDPGGKKPRKCSGSSGEYRTGNIKARILL